MHAHLGQGHAAWDPRTSARSATGRGLDVGFATLIFTGPTVERTDTRREYREVRRLAIFRVTAATRTVVYTDQAMADGTPERRIISARASTRRERQVHEAA